METKNGRTFWDLVEENKLLKISLVIMVLVIVFALVFFLSKGYTVTTSGIIPPREVVDSGHVNVINQRNDPLNRLTMLNETLTNFSKLIWVIFFLQLLTISFAFLCYSVLKGKKSRNFYIANNKKKTEVFEFIFEKFNSFTIYDRDQMNGLLIEIQTLSKYSIDKGLYIDKHLMKLINDFTDYFKEVIVDFRKKNYTKEQEFQNRFRSLFNEN